MSESIRNNKLDQLIAELSSFWRNQQDQERIAEVAQALEKRYGLDGKITKEPEAEDIIKQMAGRLARCHPNLTDVRNKRILDIACGSNSSKLPASSVLGSLFGGRSVRCAGYFCHPSGLLKGKQVEGVTLIEYHAVLSSSHNTLGTA